MIKKIILTILKSNKKLYASIVDEYIKDQMLTTKQKNKVISGMHFDHIIEGSILDNKTLLMHNCLFINTTITGCTIHGDLRMNKPYNCIISNNTSLRKDLEPIDIPDFIKTKR